MRAAVPRPPSVRTIVRPTSFAERLERPASYMRSRLYNLTPQPGGSSNFRKELRRELADLYVMVPGSANTKDNAEVLYIERYIAELEDLRRQLEADAVRASGEHREMQQTKSMKLFEKVMVSDQSHLEETIAKLQADNKKLKNKLVKLSKFEKHDACCPITSDVMRDPVMTRDGQTYERKAIEAWFARGHRTSPATNKVLRSLVIVSNTGMKKAIETLVNVN